MAGPEPLAVYLDETRVATLSEARTGKIRLVYSDEALDRWPLNSPVLSVSLLLSPAALPPGKVGPFLEGLLPEGEIRTILERRFDVRRGDTFRLLRAIGRDCAGAVVIQPESEPPPTPRTGRLDPLSEEELAGELRDLPVHPLGASEEVRVSLAGLQDKLLLARTPEGRWARPLEGHPSTHLMKPEDARYPDIAANEAFCLRLARALGLTTVDVELLEVDGRPVLAVSRYDREVRGDGTVRRIHQEDLCQALSIDVSRGTDVKYEQRGGPSLVHVARVLDEFAGGIEDLGKLLDAVTLTVVLGNADAHGRNLSLLYSSARPSLAPLYDLVATAEYPTVHTPDGERPVSTELAMRVNDLTELHAVTVEDLVAEAERWTVTSRIARERVEVLLDRTDEAIIEAAEGTPEVPAALVDRTRARVKALRDGKAAGA